MGRHWQNPQDFILPPDFLKTTPPVSQRPPNFPRWPLTDVKQSSGRRLIWTFSFNLHIRQPACSDFAEKRAFSLLHVGILGYATIVSLNLLLKALNVKIKSRLQRLHTPNIQYLIQFFFPMYYIQVIIDAHKCYVITKQLFLAVITSNSNF